MILLTLTVLETLLKKVNKMIETITLPGGEMMKKMIGFPGTIAIVNDDSRLVVDGQITQSGSIPNTWMVETPLGVLLVDNDEDVTAEFED